MPTNGFRPQEMQTRQFKQATASAIDQHASVLKDVMAALVDTQAQVKASREFVADLAAKVDSTREDLAAAIDQAGWAVAQCKDFNRLDITIAPELGMYTTEHGRWVEDRLNKAIASIGQTNTDRAKFEDRYYERMATLERLAEHRNWQTVISGRLWSMTFWGRLRWLVTGR